MILGLPTYTEDPDYERNSIPVNTRKDGRLQLGASEIEAITGARKSLLVDNLSSRVIQVIQHDDGKIDARAFAANSKSPLGIIAQNCFDSDFDGEADGVSSHRVLKADNHEVARQLLWLANDLEGIIPEDLYSLELIRFYIREGYIPRFFDGKRSDDAPSPDAKITQRLLRFMTDGDVAETLGVNRLVYAPEEAAKYWTQLAAERKKINNRLIETLAA